MEETANVPLPRPNRCSQGVEEVEGNTAELQTGWQSRFCGSERARLWRSGSAWLRLLRRRRKKTKEMKNEQVSWLGRHAGD